MGFQYYSLSKKRMVDSDEVPFQPVAQTGGVTGNLTPYQAYQIGQDKVSESQKEAQLIETKTEKENILKRFLKKEIAFEELPNEDIKSYVLANTPEGFEPKKQLSESEKKVQRSGVASLGFIDQLEKQFNMSEGGKYEGLGATLYGVSKNVKGALNLDPNVRTYNAIREGFAAQLKQLTGDTGVLTQADYERLSNLVPKFTDNPETARQKFEVLRQQMSSSFGVDAGKTGYKRPEGGEGLVDYLTDNLTGVGGAVAPFVKNPVTAAVGGVGAQTLQDILKLPKVGDPITPEQQDYYFNPLSIAKRDIKTAGQYGLESLAALLTGKAIGKILPKGGNQLPKVRAEVAKLAPEKEVAGYVDDIVKAGDKYVKQVDAGAMADWKLIKSTVKNNKTLPDLLETLSNWGSNAYKKSGGTYRGEKVLLQDTLYQAARESIKKTNPTVAKLTEEMAKQIGKKEVLKKLGWMGAGALATSVPTFALYKLLSGKK